MTHTLPSPILPVAAVLDDGVDHLVDLGVVDEHLDPDLGDEVHLVLRPSVDLGVAPLAAEALGLGEGHALDAERLEGLFDLVELEGLEDCHDQLHCALPFVELGRVNVRPPGADPNLSAGVWPR